MPILFNEDDHFDFDSVEHMVAGDRRVLQLGYFDPGKSDYSDGYQSPPVRWDLNTPRKKGLLRPGEEDHGRIDRRAAATVPRRAAAGRDAAAAPPPAPSRLFRSPAAQASQARRIDASADRGLFRVAVSHSAIASFT